MPDDQRPSPFPPGAERYLDDVSEKVRNAVAADVPHNLSYEDWHRFGAAIDDPETQCSEADLALLGLADRWFLLTRILRRRDVYQYDKPDDKSSRWLYARCREVEAAPDEHLDLWARTHYKSSIMTFAGLLQEVLRDPELTSCIFSHTRPTAKAFLSQIKQECEQNSALKALYPDVMWEEPSRQAPSWSLDRGLIFKRRGNPKEGTIEASGLVDGQPTSKHFGLRVYDDVVTLESITGREMVRKTTTAFEMSDNLGTSGGRRWVIGTRYSYQDTYQTLIDRGELTVRRYPATKTGTLDGSPVFLSEEEWKVKKRRQPSTVAAQMLQAPTAGDQTIFEPSWLRGYYVRPLTLNVYILVDPSKGKHRNSDRCAMVVLGIDSAGNMYLLDGYCHRMRLTKRWSSLRDLHKKWSKAPGVQNVSVGYETYGLQTDVEAFEVNMQREKYYFTITEVNWVRDGSQAKDDRIERLVPDVEQSRFFIPIFVNEPGIGRCTWKIDEGRVELKASVPMTTSPEMRAAKQGEQVLISKPIVRKNEVNEPYDLSRLMIDDMIIHPFGSYDDLLDATSRIYDMNPANPRLYKRDELEPEGYFDS